MNIINILNSLLIKLKLREEGSVPVDTVTKGYAPYEELDGKRTTKLGLVFVIIMVIAGIWQGQVLLRSIQATIHPPENLSTCFRDAVTRSGLPVNVTYDYSYSTYGTDSINFGGYNSNTFREEGCRYSEIEINQKFPPIYAMIQPMTLELDALGKERSIAQSELWKLKNTKDTQQQNYNTSLFENISGSNQAVYSSSSISGVLSAVEDRIATLEKVISAKESDIRTKQDEIRQILVGSASVLENVARDYENEIRFLELKRFVTSFLLLAPLVWFTVRRYFRAKNTRSEYSIIWGGAALISSLLFGQVMVVFVYRILPKRLLEALAEFLYSILQSFEFLVIILQWLGFILIPLFFGFLVYKIQKKFYNPLAVAMRSIKEGKCPKCAMKIKDSMVHCPMCSFNLRVTCPTCSATSVCFAKYCETCGKDIPDQLPEKQAEAPQVVTQ